MRQLTPTETTIYLLETLKDVREVQGKDGDGSTGLTPLMSRLYHEGSYARLEHHLRQMRDEPRTRKLWWHITHYHLCDWKIGVQAVRLKAKGNQTLTVQQPCRERIMPSICHTLKAEKLRAEGVHMLTARLESTGGVWLPKELLQVAAA